MSDSRYDAVFENIPLYLVTLGNVVMTVQNVTCTIGGTIELVSLTNNKKVEKETNENNGNGSA